jgi:hypothetical protein
MMVFIAILGCFFALVVERAPPLCATATWSLSHAKVMCRSDWCGPKTAVSWAFGNVGYAWLVTIGLVCAVFYGLGIPLLFWSIMRVNKAKLKHREYTSRFGFLSNKMSEEYPWWECVIIIRKLMLTFITVQSGGHSVRASLMNMLVLFFAAFLQFQFAPYAQKDANLAETATLVSTVLVLVVGIGQQAVLGPSSQIIQHRIVTDDSEDPEDAAAAAIEALDSFNVICYIVMGAGIVFTLCVILRRLGMAKFLYEHTMDEERRLGDDVLDMIKKSHIDNANAWAGIIAEDSDLRTVTEVFTSIREFKTSMQFMAAAGLDAWHGVMKTHLAVEGESALDIISGARRLMASDVRQMTAAAGIQDLPDKSVEAMCATIQSQVDIERLRMAQKILDDTEAIGAITELIIEQSSRRQKSPFDEHSLRDQLQPLTLEQLIERAMPAGVEDMRSPQFAKFFPEELVPTLYAWMSWADPKMILELDCFIRSISEINKEQLYAAVPKRIRKRLIEAAQPAVAINRQSMIRSSIHAEAEFELEEFQPDNDPVSETASASNQQNLAGKTATHDPAALEHAERVKRCTAMLGFNPFEEDKDSSMDALRLTASDPFNLRKSRGRGLSQGLLDQQGREERRKMEHAQRVLARRWNRFLRWLQQYVFQLIAGIAVVFVVCMGAALFVENAGCCPHVLEGWESSFFDPESCAANALSRGTMCKVKCKDGYKPADCASAGSNCVSEMTSWTCGRESRLSPKWRPVNSLNQSYLPHCVPHGCYVGPDEMSKIDGVVNPRSKNPLCKLEDQSEGADPKCKCRGACKDLPGGNFTCSCAPGYSGPTCDHDVGCDNKGSICGGPERGQCVPTGARYRCECAKGWAGPVCQWHESDRSCPVGAAAPEGSSRYCGAMQGTCVGRDGASVNNKYQRLRMPHKALCEQACNEEPECVAYAYFDYLARPYPYSCYVFGPGVAEMATSPWISDTHHAGEVASNQSAAGAVCVAVAGRRSRSNETFPWHLAPHGYSTCDYGETATLEQCAAAAAYVTLQESATSTPGLSHCNGTACNNVCGSWGWVPHGCSVQANSWTPHYRQAPSAPCSGCSRADPGSCSGDPSAYRLVCSTPKPVCHKQGGSDCLGCKDTGCCEQYYVAGNGGEKYNCNWSPSGCLQSAAPCDDITSHTTVAAHDVPID